jgi:hypothetical protein
MALEFTSIQTVLDLKACLKMISFTAMEELKTQKEKRARDFLKITVLSSLLTTKLKHLTSQHISVDNNLKINY